MAPTLKEAADGLALSEPLSFTFQWGPGFNPLQQSQRGGSQRGGKPPPRQLSPGPGPPRRWKEILELSQY